MKKSRIVLVFVGVCFIILWSLIISVVEGNIKSAGVPVLEFTTSVKEKLARIQGYFCKIDYYINENEELLQEITRLKAMQADAKDYEAQIKSLYELLDLQQSYKENNFSSTAAKVVAFDFDNWCHCIKIDKGAEDGVLIGNSVISPAGLVGKVVEAGEGYSIVATILNSKTGISVRMVRNSQPGLLKGDLNQKCRVEFLGDIDMVNVGDVFETTGDGGTYPEGICVGAITKIVSSNSYMYAEIRPAVEFSKLKEVLVLYDR